MLRQYNINRFEGDVFETVLGGFAKIDLEYLEDDSDYYSTTDSSSIRGSYENIFESDDDYDDDDYDDEVSGEDEDYIAVSEYISEHNGGDDLDTNDAIVSEYIIADNSSIHVASDNSDNAINSDNANSDVVETNSNDINTSNVITSYLDEVDNVIDNEIISEYITNNTSDDQTSRYTKLIDSDSDSDKCFMDNSFHTEFRKMLSRL